ncbi:MAG: hypothetical protein H7841_12975 [Magnetospirillum sp. WYHS-4]
MDLALSGRSALIADAASPVGMAIARRLAAEGCRPRLAGRDTKTLEALALALEGGAEILPADLRDPVEADVLALRSDDVDLLVACAGKAPPADVAPPLDHGWEDRVLGLSGLIREIHSLMAQRADGRPKAIVAAGMTPLSLGAQAGNAALFAVARHLANQKVPGLQIASVDPGTATPDEVAAAIAFLASPLACCLNGQILVLGGV